MPFQVRRIKMLDLALESTKEAKRKWCSYERRLILQI
jgi:hypothetical protein